MISGSLIGQNLNGKWILKEVNSGNGKKGYPGFQLLEICNNNVDIYRDFSLHEKATSLKIDNGDFLNSKNEKISRYEIVDEHHLKWYVDGKSNGKDAVFECDFYRLEPTITTLEKEDIEKLTFLLKENGSVSEFEFNEDQSEKKMIEKIDSTLFVSMYFNGKRNISIPIKEVTNEFLKLYAVPTGPMEIILYRKK